MKVKHDTLLPMPGHEVYGSQDVLFLHLTDPLEIQKRLFEANLLHFVEKERVILRKALAFAEKIHLSRMQRNGESEFDHILHVVHNLLRFGVRDVNTIIAALLHDSIEADFGYAVVRKRMTEMGATADEITDAFGGVEDATKDEYRIEAALGYITLEFNSEVAELVNLTTIRRPDPNATIDERNTSYEEQIKNIRRNPKAFIIKVADLTHNVRRLLSEQRGEDWLRTALKYLAGELEVRNGFADPALTRVIPHYNLPQVYDNTVRMFSYLRRDTVKEILPALVKDILLSKKM